LCFSDVRHGLWGKGIMVGSPWRPKLSYYLNLATFITTYLC
jgi:hypothetical protein